MSVKRWALDALLDLAAGETTPFPRLVGPYRGQRRVLVAFLLAPFDRAETGVPHDTHLDDWQRFGPCARHASGSPAEIRVQRTGAPAYAL